MSFCLFDYKLVEKYKTFWTMIKDLKKNTDLNIKFHSLNASEYGIECESFTIVSTVTLLALEINVTYKYI